MDLYFVRGKISTREIKIEVILREEQTTYIFTKALSGERFYYLINKLKVIDKRLSLREDVEASGLIDEAQDLNVHLIQAQQSGTSQ